MPTRSPTRTLRIEWLEMRALLDGAMAVSVVNGALTVTGDEKANGATLTQLDPASAPLGSFLIAPDASTSLNGGKPGESLVVSGVTAGAKIDLGGGDDHLTLQGAAGQSLASLSIETGDGSDTVGILDCTVSGSLTVTSRQGDDDVEIDRTSLGGGSGGTVGTPGQLVLQAQQGHGNAVLFQDNIGPAPTPGKPLRLVSLSASNFGLTLKGTSTGASVVSMMDKQGGAVQVQDQSSIGGKLTVISLGRLDFSMQQSSCAFDTFLKIDDASAAASPSSTNLEACKIGGALTVLSRGAQDVSLDQVQADGVVIKMGNSGGRSSTNIIDSQVAHKLDVEAVGGLDLSTENTRAAAMYLKYEGIKGEKTLDTTSLAGLTVDGALTVSSRAVAHKLSVDGVQAADMFLKFDGRSADRSSADIASAKVAHKLDVQAIGGLDFSADQSSAADMFIKFDGIKGEQTVDTTSLTGLTLDGGLSVTSSQADHKLSADGVQADRVYMKMSNVPGGRSSADITNSRVVHKLDVQALGACDFSWGQSNASSMFLKLDGIKGESAVDSTTLSGLTLSGGLTVASRGVIHKLSADGVQASDIFIKIEGISGERSSADVTNSRVVHKLDVQAAGGLDFSAKQCNAVDMFLKLDGIKGDSAVDSTTLSGLTLSGGLTVSSRGAAHKLSADGVQAADMFLKFDSPSAARSSADLTDSQVQHKMDIEARGALDLSALSARAVDMFIKLESLRTQDSPSSVSLADINLDGRLDVVSRGGLGFSGSGLHATDMFLKITDVLGAPPVGSNVMLTDAALGGQLQITTGNGDDTVMVFDSAVQGASRFDGGGGQQDSLVLVGNQFASPPKIAGFESVLSP